MSQQRQFLIPRKVMTRLEFLPGIGLRELVGICAGLAVGVVAFRLAAALHAPAFIRVVAAVIPPAIAFYLFVGEEESLLTRLQRSRSYSNQPQRFLHKVGSGSDVSKRATPAGRSTGPGAIINQVLGRKPKEEAIGTNLPPTVQRWLPVRDVQNGILLRRDGALVAAIQVDPVNLALKSSNEQVQLIRAIHEAVNSLQYPVQVLSIPRPLDLDGYVKTLEARAKEVSPERAQLLNQHIRYVSQLVAGGEAQERRYYILMPSATEGKGAVDELLQRVHDLAGRLTTAGLKSQVLNDLELFSLLHVWSHPAQAAIERPPVTGPAPITRLEV